MAGGTTVFVEWSLPYRCQRGGGHYRVCRMVSTIQMPAWRGALPCLSNGLYHTDASVAGGTTVFVEWSLPYRCQRGWGHYRVCRMVSTIQMPAWRGALPCLSNGLYHTDAGEQIKHRDYVILKFAQKMQKENTDLLPPPPPPRIFSLRNGTGK